MYEMLKEKKRKKSHRLFSDSDELPLKFSESSFDDAITWNVC